MKFIDLFAGLGGFHVALNKLGHECVFASEKKEILANLYHRNFNISVDRDITKIQIDEIPVFDILCAGFPCQPFSKAGSQKGLNDENNGSLFDKIVEILDFHKPNYFILENVRNLEKHDNFNTWNYIEKKLHKDLGYAIDKCILSPHNFGIPQHRERLFIVGSLSGLSHFQWPQKTNATTSIFEYLDTNSINKNRIEVEKEKVLDVWQEFIDRIPVNDKMPSFPIWAMEFGANYPYEDAIPFQISKESLGKYKGSFGIELKGLSKKEMIENIPKYSQLNQTDKNGKNTGFPSWKKRFIKQNREFYQKYKIELKSVIKKIESLEINSWQKFEWNNQNGERSLSKHLIQFRGSGIRVKKTNYFPSLVTVHTQTPILGWERRYITTTEAARIQALDCIELPETTNSAFYALGNAVNVELVKLISNNLIVEKNKRTNLQRSQIG